MAAVPLDFTPGARLAFISALLGLLLLASIAAAQTTHVGDLGPTTTTPMTSGTSCFYVAQDVNGSPGNTTGTDTRLCGGSASFWQNAFGFGNASLQGIPNATLLGGSSGAFTTPSGSAVSSFLGLGNSATQNIPSATLLGGTGSAFATPSAATATSFMNAFSGDTGSGGIKGLVPAPSAGDAVAGKVLGAGGGWIAPPFATVKTFGARGDGSTDDTTAIQAAINSKTSGGMVYFPVGHYCVKTGPLTISNRAVTLWGESRQGSTASITGENLAFGAVLDACGTDVSIIQASGDHDLIKSLHILGSNVPGTTNPAVALNSGCVECTVQDSEIQRGSNAINVSNAYEIYILDTAADSVYGQAIIYIAGAGGYIRKGKFDQAYPYANPTPGSTTFPVPNWASTHSYAAGAFVITGGYILQATVGGTSGSSPPATPPYGTTVGDGSVTWGLVGASTYYGVQCDTGCGSSLYIDDSDFSADETAGIGLTNTLAGTAPHFVEIAHNTFGNNLYNNIAIGSGFALQIQDNISGGGLAATNSSSISLFASGDDVIISGNLLEIGGPTGGSTAIFVNSANVNIENNICSAMTCVSVAAGVSHFRIIGNSWFSGFGASGTGVFVASGNSDYYDIIGNDSGGVTTTVNDGGTGVHKNIIDAGFNTAKINQHLFQTPTVAPTIASGFGSSPSISGSDSAGRITVGSGGAATGAITFGTAFPIGFNPACVANDETSGNLMRASATSTTLTLSGTMSASDTLTWLCVGY